MRMIRVSCLVVTLLLLYRITGQAEPTTCLGSTPTERLISNLERLVSDKPGDASLHFTLARAHSIAYALNSPVIRDCETGSPTTNVLSDFAGNVPPIPTAPTAYRSGADAQRHLNAAIAGYARAVSLAPEDAFARLGYGWALQQAGRITEAIAQYRQAIAVAWPGDERRNTRPAPQGLERTEWLPPMGWTRFVTVEAGEYLIPLLDATGDAQEIAALRDRMAFIAKAPRMISPVVVPLQRDLGLTGVLDPTARVSFDLDGFGPRMWTWITPHAGWRMRHTACASAMAAPVRPTMYCFMNAEAAGPARSLDVRHANAVRAKRWGIYQIEIDDSPGLKPRPTRLTWISDPGRLVIHSAVAWRAAPRFSLCTAGT